MSEKSGTSPNEHAWLLQPIARAVNHVNGSAFYQWARALKRPADFAPAALQNYFVSLNFPKVIGLMTAMTPDARSPAFCTTCRHAHEEADHHLMLRNWMAKHSIIQRPDDLLDVRLTVEASSAIASWYRWAIEGDIEKWVVAFNCALEMCSKESFIVLASKMREIGGGDTYFDIHVTADETHSGMGLDLLECESPQTIRRKQLLWAAMDSVAIWSRMINSWIGVTNNVVYEIDGSARNSSK